MIATGGTIASKNTGEGLAPAITSKELLDCVPEIAEICHVQTVQPFNLDSTDVYYKHWLSLAELIERHYGEYDGFVVTHGTDTMAYTAAALSYLIQNSKKPIVLTGSQKSAYLRDTDARKNLYDAFCYCADDRACGVHIVFDGNVILGTRAKKTRTRSYNAFASVDFPSVAVMRDQQPFFYIEEKTSGEPKFFHDLNPNVFVLKITPGMRAEILHYLVQQYDGLIVESFGSGGMPAYESDEFLQGLQEFSDRNKPVVVTTQVEREGSALKTYAVGKRLLRYPNVIEAHCMTLEAALTKLMWTLARTGDMDEIRKLFYSPVQYDGF